MVRFDSWRAVSPGNGADRNLATKSTQGGRAIRRAVMRVKLEQAPKAAMWMPIWRESGEGSTEREEPGAGVRQHGNHREPVRSTGVVSTARRKGNPRQWGRPGMAGESRILNAARKSGGPSGRRRGSDVFSRILSLTSFTNTPEVRVLPSTGVTRLHRKRRQHEDDDGGTGTVYAGLAQLFRLLRNARGVDRFNTLGPVCDSGRLGGGSGKHRAVAGRPGWN